MQRLAAKTDSTKKYFIILDIYADQVDWRELYDPQHHELILVVYQYSLIQYYKILKKKKQLKYFSKIIKLKNFTYDELYIQIGEFISSLLKLGIELKQIEIIGNSEACLLKAARLREAFNLNGSKPHEIIQFRNKIETKAKLFALGKYLPKYLKFDCTEYKVNPDIYLQLIVNKLGFPIFAKPIDLSGSFAVRKINNLGELKRWCEEFKENFFMELDEFISGSLYHCESFIKGGKILRIDIGTYLNPIADVMVAGKLTGSIDILESDPDWDKIYQFNEVILESLRPPNGCVHLEFFKTAEGKLIFLECAARTPTGVIPKVRKISTGIDCHLIHYKLQMGLDTNLQTIKGPYSAGGIIPITEEGIMEKRCKLKGLLSQHTIHWYNKPGDRIEKSKLSFVPQFVGIIILKNNNFEALKQDFENLEKKTFYTVNPLDPQSFFRNLLEY